MSETIEVERPENWREAIRERRASYARMIEVPVEVECEKCSVHSSGLCWPHSIEVGMARLDRIDRETWKSIFGTGTGATIPVDSAGRPGTDHTAGTVARVVDTFAGIDRGDIADQVIDTLAGWIGRAHTGTLDYRFRKLVDSRWLDSFAYRVAVRKCSGASTGRGFIKLAEPAEPTPVPVREPAVLVDESTGSYVPYSDLASRDVRWMFTGTFRTVPVEWRAPRALDDIEVGALDKGKAERQARTFSFSSWTSPDGRINPQSGAPMARPIALGGLVETWTRWHYRETGAPLSKVDSQLIGLAVDAVRGGWRENKKTGAVEWIARFKWSDALGVEVSRADSMRLRRAIEKLVPAVDYSIHVRRGVEPQFDSGRGVPVIGSGRGVPVISRTVPAPNEVEELIVPAVHYCENAECIDREYHESRPGARASRSKKSRLQVAINRLAVDRETLSSLMTFHLAV